MKIKIIKRLLMLLMVAAISFSCSSCDFFSDVEQYREVRRNDLFNQINKIEKNPNYAFIHSGGYLSINEEINFQTLVEEKIREDGKNIKETFFTKHEKEHSEKFNKIMDILNNYSILWHVLLSMVVVFLVELASRWSIPSAISFIAKTPLVFIYNSFIVFASLTLVYLFRRRAFVRLIVSSFWIILGIINGEIF